MRSQGGTIRVDSLKETEDREEIFMMAFLNHIRCVEKKISLKRQMINTIAVTFLGIALGAFSKFLDTVPVNDLPALFSYLDVTNFLGRFAIWIFIAVCISIYSVSSIRAAINVFLFFAGMVLSYYLYSFFIAGFFPKSYAMIWVGFTICSPLLAFICWYAKGNGRISLVLSAGIIAVLFHMSFVYGPGYFNSRSLLEALTFLCGCAVMKRQSMADTVIMMVIGAALAIVLHTAVPFSF